MQITIYSAMADDVEYRIAQMEYTDTPGPEWSGDVDLTMDLGGMPNHAQPLEAIFRFFNRVTEDDGPRLESMGYFLPSLSVGDVVTMEGTHYLVCGSGFKAVSQQVVNEIKRNPRDAWMIAHKWGRS
jgi:hypothetical protein